MSAKLAYRPVFPSDDDYFRAHPGDRLITNFDYETSPFPKGVPSPCTWRNWLAYCKRLSVWLAVEGNRMHEIMGDPVRYDPKQLTEADCAEINHLLFDPEWKPLIMETIRLRKLRDSQFIVLRFKSNSEI